MCWRRMARRPTRKTAARSVPWRQTSQRAPATRVARASVDQGSTGAQAAQDAEAHHRHLAVVQWFEAKPGCVLLPKRWVVERSHAWAARLHRLARDDAQWAETLQGLHGAACAILIRQRVVDLVV